jgi:hypothetical protein
MVLAVLKEHLGDAERTLPSSVLHERVERDLRSLRAEGQDWSSTAQAYIADWLNDGLLERRLRTNASEEEYELTPPAWQAIRFVESLTRERTVATESRLSTVISQLSLLAEQTDKDPESRTRSLKIERDKIDQQIEALRHGSVTTLSDEQAIERARDIINLADELANDFRSVRSSFERLNQSLRESILESDGSRGDVLEKLFADVDVISESESGRTFKAFWRLLTDPEQSTQLELALEQVLDRDFSNKLSRKERLFLLRLTNLLLEQGKDVHEVLQHFARSLKLILPSNIGHSFKQLSS